MHLLSELEKLSLVASRTENIVIITDELRRIDWVNESFTRVYGYELNEVIGKKPSEVLFGPETNLEKAAQISRQLEQLEPVKEEQINYTKFGKKIWVQLDITPVLEESGQIRGYVAIQADITIRKEQEQKLRRNWREYDEIYEQAVMPMCFTNTEGKFVRVNKAYCDLFECKQEDLLGKDFIESHFAHLPQARRDEMREESNRIVEMRDTSRKEVRFNSFSGKPLVIEVIRKMVEVNGTPVISMYLVDTTEKRDFQLRILEQNKRLKEFAFLTSHKLRQPLANILGLIELVKSESQSRQDVTITIETLRMLTSQLDGVVHEMGQVLAELDMEVEKSLFLNEQEDQRIHDVWIVDDDQVITYITQRLMKNADPTVKVTEFLSAKMALEKLRLDQAQPDILLLDINMPGITGWEFLDELRSMHRFVNVYMYSSSIDPEDVKKARSYPMVRDFLSKPVDMETVRNLLSVPIIRTQVS